jgi:DNA-binding transcriptional regulator YiaG
METSNIDFLEVFAKKVADIVLAEIKPLLADRQPKPLTREELMKKLDISSATLWKWEQTGEIKRAFTKGRRAYYYLPNT